MHNYSFAVVFAVVFAIVFAAVIERGGVLHLCWPPGVARRLGPDNSTRVRLGLDLHVPAPAGRDPHAALAASHLLALILGLRGLSRVIINPKSNEKKRCSVRLCMQSGPSSSRQNTSPALPATRRGTDDGRPR